MIVAMCTVTAAIALPVAASAQTVSELQQQIQSVLARIAQLQQDASSTAATATTASTPASLSNIICPTLVRTLALGASGTDVANLQGFLAQNPLIYPEQSVTGHFGIYTQDAVQRWQTAYGIVSLGSPATTGYGVVGPRTRAAILASCAKSTNGQSTPFIIPNSASQPLCPVAPEPSTPCAGTWSPLANANGCTIAWQCAVPLPAVAASSSASSSAPSACAAYTMPSCIGGTLQWLGMSGNNCNLGYQCVIPGR
jgi:hypothetical protein